MAISDGRDMPKEHNDTEAGIRIAMHAGDQTSSNMEFGNL